MDRSTFDDVLWNGDLNYDKTRNSSFVAVVNRFLSRIGLVSVWDHYPVDYTHVHTDYISTSTLDHFVVNERLIDLISDCGTMHLRDNPSRHSPIILKLDISAIPLKSKVEPVVSKKPVWYKATEQDIMNYTVELHRYKEQPSRLHFPRPDLQGQVQDREVD